MTPAQERLARQMAAAVTRAMRGVAPRVPEAGRLLWRWFADLCGARAGVAPISFAEIEAYARLHGLRFAPHHVELLHAMDAAWLSAGTDLPARRPAPMTLTATIFDAVF